MSKYIVPMKIPKHCSNCPFDILDSDYKFFPESVTQRFLEIIDDEIEARKIMLADLGEE